MQEFKPGIYKHYKGGLYNAVCLVKHHDSRADYVLYFSLSRGNINIRPLYGYNDVEKGLVDPDGFLDSVTIVEAVSEVKKVVPRFEYMGPAE